MSKSALKYLKEQLEDKSIAPFIREWSELSSDEKEELKRYAEEEIALIEKAAA